MGKKMRKNIRQRGAKRGFLFFFSFFFFQKKVNQPDFSARLRARPVRSTAECTFRPCGNRICLKGEKVTFLKKKGLGKKNIAKRAPGIEI
jgi:hypothetical protein